MEVIKLFDIPKEVINDNERQRRVYSIEGISPSVLSRSDSAKIMEVKVIGQMDNTIDHTFESANRVYDKDGLAPTINTCGGGGLQPKIIQEPVCLNSKGGRNGIEGLQPSLQDRVYSTDSIGVSVTTCYMPSILEEKPNYRIRKTTPLENWRLMDFSDDDFHKAESVNSNTQLYKQAGNSIVRNVLVAIIGQMLPGKENIYKGGQHEQIG